jgi:hypothetical protein
MTPGSGSALTPLPDVPATPEPDAPMTPRSGGAPLAPRLPATSGKRSIFAVRCWLCTLWRESRIEEFLAEEIVLGLLVLLMVVMLVVVMYYYVFSG